MQNSRNPLFALLLIISLSRFNYFIIPIAGNPELRALIEIKSSLDPINKHFTSWMADGNHCDGTFEGVACNVHGKVANISLQGKGLTGKLPTAVAELKCLSGLYLHYNSLTGEIPKEIANLTELTDLYLNFNSLSGSIPSEIGSMANLQVLQLSYNQLRGNIPKEMGFLKKLDVLALENNRLTGQIPASLGNLRLLKRLYLSSNQLYGSIPHTLVTNPSLEVLHVQNNALSGVIPPGNYYLADSGYTNGPGFLTPYRGVRYHLKERDHGSDAPCNYKELYNLRHAKARNVIDRSFDLLKIRWTVLHNYSFYNIFIQNKTIMACCLLQNFFRCDMIVDPLENADLGQEDNVVGTQSFLYEFVDQVEHTQECTNCRETLAVNMYNEWLSSR